MNSPDLRQLRHFVAVAERLHFGRAAAALHISQPPLSRSIRDLEARVGATLLARSRRKVELTPEGARFLEEAKRLLAQLERAVLEVGRMAAGTGGRLRIGFVSLADFGVLPGLLKAYKAALPGVALALREMLSPEQSAALAANELDFGLLLPPVAVPELEHLVVQRDRFVAALPARHRLARGRGALAARELADEAFVMVPRQMAPGLHDIVSGITARAGFAPRLAQEAIQMQTVVSLVSSGLGVALVPACLANLGRRGVVYREISDPHPRLDLWLAWRRAPGGIAASAAGREFVTHAKRLAR
ncbi:MAG TPA: LysR family transcriptional regulator [Burkholderiales bacterium]|jgi:DNA-binding transcriptional LysR family regulator|nr:LysR family transcriptional regulator [Burkholderiales bacterium]